MVVYYRKNYLGRVCSGEILTDEFKVPPAIIPLATYIDFAAGKILLYFANIITIIIIILATTVVFFGSYIFIKLMNTNK